MAELHVQRKRNNYRWLWLILLLILIAAGVFYYLNYYQKNDNTVSNLVKITGNDSPGNTRSNNDAENTMSIASVTTSSWDDVNFNAPDTAYAEVKDKMVNEKADNRYAIYSMKDHILFENNKSDLRVAAEEGLKQIGASISQRFNDTDVKIFSFPDSSKENNQQLSRQRAETVKTFLVNNSKVDEKQISIFQAGESSSPGANSSTVDTHKNNSIEIVVKR